MKKEIRIPIQDKVFTKEDVLRIAQLFWKEYSENQSGSKNLKYVFTCEGIHETYEIEDNKLDDQREFLDTKKIAGLRMRFTDYSSDKHLELSLAHGKSSFHNEFGVKAKDTAWVDSKHKEFENILISLKPQRNWFLDHKKILFHIASLNLGLLWVRLVWLLPTQKNSVR